MGRLEDMQVVEAVKCRILELCEERKITINHLCDMSGIPASTVKSILNGKSQHPQITTIAKLCDGLDISVAEFFDTETFRNLEQEIK